MGNAAFTMFWSISKAEGSLNDQFLSKIIDLIGTNVLICWIRWKNKKLNGNFALKG